MKIHIIFLVPPPPPTSTPLKKQTKMTTETKQIQDRDKKKKQFYLINLSNFVVFEYNLRGGCYEDWSFFVRPEKEKGISHFLILTPSGRSQQDKT